MLKARTILASSSSCLSAFDPVERGRAVRYVEAMDESGETVEWDFELTTPNILMRRGRSKDSLQPGDRVTVTGWRARNAPHVANADSVVLENGKRLFTGSAGSDEGSQRSWIPRRRAGIAAAARRGDRKSTRLNSSHVKIAYA